MAQKHLKELLKEDQEPFHLKDYIANKHHQLKNQPQKTQIQVKKPKPISKNPSFFCKNACFFSLQDSPDPHKSPLFDFTKCPCKSPNRAVLHVPAKTASLLLEAALSIQKQTKPKTQIKNSGFGLFGSMLKKFTQRNRAHKLKNSETEHRKTGENRGDLVIEEKLVNVNSSSLSSSSSSSTCCSCNERISSLDLESSSSGRSINGCDNDDYDDDNDGFVFANLLKENDGDYGLCLSPLSPLSPFRFALRSSPSPDRRSSMLCSPVKSPVHDNIEDNVDYEQKGSGKFQVEEDEEDKEQNSPVSVLDPPFEDDYDGHEGGGYNLECSYVFVQRAKHHLLHKLQRFEKLAELDPIELEKRLIEDEVDYEDYDYESFNFDEEIQVDQFINGIIKKSGFQDIKKPGIKRLISDLIIEEESVENATLDNEEHVIKRVCKRLESWKEVEANTIDMMVGMDLRREIGDWKKHQEQIDETAKDLEIALFALLVDELVNDL